MILDFLFHVSVYQAKQLWQKLFQALLFFLNYSLFLYKPGMSQLKAYIPKLLVCDIDMCVCLFVCLFASVLRLLRTSMMQHNMNKMYKKLEFEKGSRDRNKK